MLRLLLLSAIALFTTLGAQAQGLAAPLTAEVTVWGGANFKDRVSWGSVPAFAGKSVTFPLNGPAGEIWFVNLQIGSASSEATAADITSFYISIFDPKAVAANSVLNTFEATFPFSLGTDRRIFENKTYALTVLFKKADPVEPKPTP